MQDKDSSEVELDALAVEVLMAPTARSTMMGSEGDTDEFQAVEPDLDAS